MIPMLSQLRTSLAFWILLLFVQLSANDLRAHRIEQASASNSFAPRCSGVAFGRRCIKGVHVLAMVAYAMPLATGERRSRIGRQRAWMARRGGLRA